MRTPNRLTRAAVPLVAAPVLLVTLAACGGGDDAKDAEPTSASASATATSSVSTADFQALVEKAIDEATTADIDLQLVTSGGTLTGSGQVDYTGDDPELALKMKAPSMGNIELRVVDHKLFISIPALDKSGTFFESDLDSADASKQLGGLTGFDPTAALTALSKSVTDVTLDGSEQLDGTSVEHYTFRADGSALPGASSTASKQITVQAWFDDQDRLRKTETALSASTKVSVTLSDWGTDVDITAPPAAKVKPMPTGQ